MAFLFKNRKRIRIYDMEIEEEDEEDDTLGTSGLSSSEFNTMDANNPSGVLA